MKSLKKISVLYPEIYLVTRRYGGPEEGGWWWDHRELRKTFTPRIINSPGDREYLAEAVARLARFLNRSESRRALGSVLSDGMNEGFVAAYPGEFATHEQPRYE